MNREGHFEVANFLRKSIREVMGLAFWLHAIYIFGLISYPHPIPHQFFRYLPNFLLLIFIINYSLFTDKGWWSVFFDLGYIYFLPVVFLARISRTVWKISFTAFKSKIIWHNPKLLPEPPTIAAQPKVIQSEETKGATETPAKARYFRRLGRLFFKFSALWALLVFTVDAKPFLLIATAASLFGAMKAIVNLSGIFSAPSDWVDKFENRLAAQIAAQIQTVVSWDGRSEPREVRKNLNSVKLLAAVCNFISDNSSVLSSWAFAISIAISVPFYCYISFMFSSVYLGIAKLGALKLTFPEAFVDSLFMPFAWSSLPSSLLIRLIGGIQATCVSIIGYNVLFRHLGNRLDKITKAALSLRSPFAEESLKAKMSIVENMLSKPGSVPQKASDG
jgi:hypothetical protein